MAAASAIIDIQPMTILFLGDRNIGKTTFLRTYYNHIRNSDNNETFEGFYLVFRQFSFCKERHERLFNVRLLDLPAGVTAADRRDQYPTAVDLIVLCFAVDDTTSLHSVLHIWLPEIRRHYAELPRFHLLGLRNDLRERRLELLRELISLETALQFHQAHPFSRDYMETSSVTTPEHAIYLINLLIDHVFFYRGLHLGT